ncbi:hypothetical protein GCM10011324_45120 [Allosediminivita pacifica]|nr:hypothetical protein GCM10011324_45120 [Allosediminivita pacifica]
MVEVVQRDDTCRTEAAQQTEQVELVTDVEVVCGFVEQDLSWLLGQSARNLDALADLPPAGPSFITRVRGLLLCPLKTGPFEAGVFG